MSDLKTAAKQALDILDSEFTTVDGEFCRWCDGRLNAKHNCLLEQTIKVLRAALAELQTADDLREPKNGAKWRVEWWNESCRMMLPEDRKLDSFVSYKNGTLQFTIKRTPT